MYYRKEDLGLNTVLLNAILWKCNFAERSSAECNFIERSYTECNSIEVQLRRARLPRNAILLSNLVHCDLRHFYTTLDAFMRLSYSLIRSQAEPKPLFL